MSKVSVVESENSEHEIIFEYVFPTATAEDTLADRPDGYRVVDAPEARNGVIIYALYHGQWRANPWNTRSLVRVLLEKLHHNNISEPAGDIYELERQHIAWVKETFADESPLGAIKHLQREVKELHDNPADITEYADCLLLLMSTASRAGFSMHDIVRAGWEKLAVNKGREWGTPDSEGIIEHTR